jgi:drug/metabolite transporter (DMT)-like permease
MAAGLLCAVGTALCYGMGSILQSAAATSATPVAHADPRLLLRLLRTWRYPAGLALDAIGFVLYLAALRVLPLYVVQSVTSGFLAVTAVAGVVLLGLRMHARDVAAVVVVVLGLTLVGLSAAPQSARVVGPAFPWVLLCCAVALVAAAVPASRWGSRGAGVLGGLAGLGFGVTAVAARALSPTLNRGSLAADLRVLVGSPALYALLVASALALLAYATALQRGTVVQATAPLVVGETVLPALTGLVFLGDHPRPGWGAAAAVGFVLAVLGALLLSRYGDADEPSTLPG